jgi:hypothetical protein
MAFIECGEFRLAACVLEQAFDWDAVPPGRAYWATVHHKLLALPGPDRVTVMKSGSPVFAETVPMGDFLERLKKIVADH